MSCRVSFLVPDIGAPSVGAAVRMAESLKGACEYELVGPDFGLALDQALIACPR